MSSAAQNEDRPYVTVVEAAKLSGLSITTLTRWAQNGWLPCVVVAGETRFARKHLEAIVAPLNGLEE